MKTHYHCHVTVKEIKDIPRGWKRTEILLIDKDREQTDIMLTKHYCSGVKDINGLEDILNDVKHLNLNNIIRVKVEQDNNFNLPVSNTNYLEVHMLMPFGKYPKGEMNWVRSTNPRKLDQMTLMYFYNLRIYDSEDINKTIKDITDIQKDNGYIELKFEQVIFDSNKQHDAWWA